MPSFPDSIFLFILALLLFGPKKLPMLARELGKWVGEFRRASNEFKMQMEEELRQVEQADREKQIAAMEAAAPVAPLLEEPAPLPSAEAATEGSEYIGDEDDASDDWRSTESEWTPEPDDAFAEPDDPHASEPDTLPAPLPIATSGRLSMMPPATGLPTPRTRSDALGGGFLDAIPVTGKETPAPNETPAEAVAIESGAHVS